jgi:hypothetical protein
MIKTLRKHLLLVAAVITLSPITSFAVPSFARQTGMDCAACHISFPELTPFGREFKLNGYTLGERQALPVAAMAQLSMTHVDKQSTSGNDYMTKQNDPQFDGLSVFVASKISDYAGAFVQWTYENLDHFNTDGGIGHHSHVDNVDIRVVGHHDFWDKNLTFGLNLNNNPTVQDVWNSTPAWGFPFNGSKLAGLGGSGGFSPNPSSGSAQIDGGLAQSVAGLGGYFFWDRHLYGELSFYGTADKIFRPLSYGNWYNDAAHSALAGHDNPYWRLAWNESRGAHSLMLGTYGMQVNIYPDATNRNGPTDRYTDTALDAQYQYLSDPHIFTVQTTYIHEKQDLMSTFANGGSSNPINKLNEFKLKGSYLYNRKYGATLAYFQTKGSADDTLYTNLNNGWVYSKPDNRGYIAELDYNPWTNVRMALQYTGYTKIDGSSSNYDGTGRKASDNNTLFFNTWFAF